MTKNSAHRKALEKIALNPFKWGIDKVCASAIEMTLFDRKRVIAKPDILFYCADGSIHIIEYKGNGNGQLLERA